MARARLLVMGLFLCGTLVYPGGAAARDDHASGMVAIQFASPGLYYSQLGNYHPKLRSIWHICEPVSGGVPRRVLPAGRCILPSRLVVMSVSAAMIFQPLVAFGSTLG